MATVLLLATGALTCATAAAQSDTPAPDDGAAAYVALGCGACHGAAGEGTPAGPALAGTSLDAEAFTAFVRRPVRTMPAYPSAAVSDGVLAAMHAYLRTQSPPLQTGGSVSAGAEAYRASGCYQCHADEAQGGMHGPRIGPEPISLPRFVWYVRHPSASMPPYSEDVLPVASLIDIHAFLTARPAPRPLADIPLLAP